MAYDRPDWHYGGDYPKELPSENGGTHIGIFLAWVIIRHLEGDLHHDNERDEQALQAVRDRTMTGRDFLFRQCDEKFWEDDLNEEGNRFAKWYYESNKEGRPCYIDDYAQVFDDMPNNSLYYLEDSWANYELMAKVIDRRFDEWKRGVVPLPLGKFPKTKPWWKFW